MARAPYLTKSTFVAGLRCPKLLWWRFHEPDAPELIPDEGLKAVFDRGHLVGAAARSYVPGGILIDVPHREFAERLAATRAAMGARAPAVYEASFMEDGVFVAVDVLERRARGHALIEVKSTLDVKGEHIPDVAIQLHVLRRAGIAARRAEVMHLNRECRHPDLSNLFVREDVTKAAEAAGALIPKQARAFLSVLRGPCPEAATGPHCGAPYECPFVARCWPRQPRHHVSTLYRITAARASELVALGYETIQELPADYPASGPAGRQIRSVKRRRRVVEPGLKEALAPLAPPIAFLDFEAIGPAIPVWRGCAPYEYVPVQFSCHVVGRGGGAVHHEWLAEGPGDPRRGIAEALLAACEGASTLVAYNAPFERRCVAGLAAAVPSLAAKLNRLGDRLADLLPILRDHVYHPAFLGSFGLKSVLPALVEGMGYGDLEIQDGGTAALALEGLLLSPDSMTLRERLALRKRLLAYCERDTLAMVRLHERLRALAAAR